MGRGTAAQAQQYGATAILTTGQTDDVESPAFSSQTVRFAEKTWRRLLLSEEDITADADVTEQVVLLR